MCKSALLAPFQMSIMLLLIQKFQALSSKIQVDLKQDLGNILCHILGQIHSLFLMLYDNLAFDLKAVDCGYPWL